MDDGRREFHMLEPDREFLDYRGPWEAVVEEGVRWVVLHRYAIPGGYNHASVSVALEVPRSYPDTQIDMAYFWPHLALASGRAIRQLSGRRFDGKTWQRWSRHRTGNNPWRRDYDCIETHLLLVEEWIEREVRCVG